MQGSVPACLLLQEFKSKWPVSGQGDSRVGQRNDRGGPGILLTGLSPGNSRSLAGSWVWAQPADGFSPSSPGALCVPIRTRGTRASSKGCVVSKLSHQVSSPMSSPPVPSGQATSCCLPHCPPFIPLADGRSIPPKQMAMRQEIRHPRAHQLPGLARAQLLFLGLPCPPCKSCRVLGGAALGPSNPGGRL